eukprot:TRINITY_DN2624_c0_g1_i23.p1 TRINITY_DN2624_c0_g1~~TRINITY_DN2624_c0_g1_i23.p1  ORF type:complete len:130 (-),score=17.21 TRINITY_DN2624_c0_g1_i23:57-446(-)
MEFNQKHPMEGSFKPNAIPDDFYESVTRTHFANKFEEIWTDKDLFLSFREFLYEKYVQEHLTFLMEAVHYESHFEIFPENRTKRAQEMYQKFFAPKATHRLNVAESVSLVMTTFHFFPPPPSSPPPPVN